MRSVEETQADRDQRMREERLASIYDPSKKIQQEDQMWRVYEEASAPTSKRKLQKYMREAEEALSEEKERERKEDLLSLALTIKSVLRYVLENNSLPVHADKPDPPKDLKRINIFDFEFLLD